MLINIYDSTDEENVTITAFRDVTPCSVACSYLFTALHGVTAEDSVVFIVTTIRTSDLTRNEYE
jgi:hypothetical protein